MFSIPFVLTGIKTCFVKNPKLALLQEKLIDAISNGNFFIDFAIQSSFKLSVILIIIFAITLYEINLSKKDRKKLYQA